jgi:hypothetical protein
MLFLALVHSAHWRPGYVLGTSESKEAGQREEKLRHQERNSLSSEEVGELRDRARGGLAVPATGDHWDGSDRGVFMVWRIGSGQLQGKPLQHNVSERVPSGRTGGGR